MQQTKLKTSRSLAIVSVVTGAFSVIGSVLCLGLAIGPIAVIIGFLSRLKAAESRGLANTGMILGAGGLLVSLLWLIFGLQPGADRTLYGTWLWDGSNWKLLARSTEDLGITEWGGESLFYWTDLGGLIDSDGTRWNGTNWVANPVTLPFQLTTQYANQGGDIVSDGATILDEADDRLLVIQPTTALEIDAWSNGTRTVVVGPSRYPRARFGHLDRRRWIQTPRARTKLRARTGNRASSQRWT